MSPDSRSWIASARAASCALVALLLAGCPTDSGDTDTDATSNATTAPGTTEPGTTAPTSTDASTTSTTAGAELGHAADIQAIWDANCVTGCHAAGGTGAAWMLLTPDVAYSEIVSQPSLSYPLLTLVVPGDPDNSYLLNKLDNTQGDVGGGTAPMPQPPAMALSQADIDKIEAWIAQGAKP